MAVARACLQVTVLRQLDGVPHVPTLHGTGLIDGPDSNQQFKYMVTTPLGQHLGSDSDAGMILKAASHVAEVIAALESKGLIHRCV